MASQPPNSPYGLPASPRSNHQMLSPLNTSLSPRPSQSGSQPPSPYTPNEKSTPQVFVDPRKRNRDSLIFANATIPLSPLSSTSSASPTQPLHGLAPPKRNGFARLFCCFGREERARRRIARLNDYEKVGEDCHWTEY